jgi:hypothetical protein
MPLISTFYGILIRMYFFDPRFNTVQIEKFLP